MRSNGLGAAARNLVAPARILIAPNTFKGAMTAAEAAAAMARGVARAAGDHGVKVRVDVCPVADGGEGTLEALATAAAFKAEAVEVEGPFGEPITARWARVRTKRSKLITATTLFIQAVLIIWLTLMYTAYLILYGGRGGVAVVEAASVVGLALVPADRRDPTRVSTFGLGKLIQKAFNTRAKRVVVALGGTASCDGGVGMAAALGVKFYDQNGALIERPTGADLRRICRVDPSGIDPETNGARLVAACDVDNPLTGTNGAARVYGPQKGATPEQVEDLDLGLEQLVRLCREAGLHADPDAPGAGAAGGLGFALATFCGAELRPGAQAVLETVRFGRRLDIADLVLTGEGRLDSQTLRGKAPIAVARMAAERGVPVIVFAGRVGAPFDPQPDRDCEPWEIPGNDAALFDRIVRISPADMDDETAIARGPELLEQATAEAVRAWLLA